MSTDLSRGRARAAQYVPPSGVERDWYRRPDPGSLYPMRWDDPYQYVRDQWFGWAEGLVPSQANANWDEVEDWDTAPLRSAVHTAATGEWEDLTTLVDVDGKVTGALY